MWRRLLPRSVCEQQVGKRGSDDTHEPKRLKEFNHTPPPLLPTHCMHSCCPGCTVGVKEVELGCTSQTFPDTHADSPTLPALPSLRLRALPSRPDFTLCRREGRAMTTQKKRQWRRNAASRPVTGCCQRRVRCH